MLLPLLYGLREEGARAEYWHKAAAQAISDFCEGLDGGTDAYRREAREMALRLYSAASAPGSTYFLDKTPHYHWIAKELVDLFDEAKFVFLWRNPLAVVGSLLETFRGGRWEPHLLRTDLFDGVANLIAAYEHAGPRAIGVRYEDLVTAEAPWHRLFDHLGLEFDSELLQSFQAVSVQGRFGDPTGSRKYKEASTASIQAWRRVVANPVRRRWCRRYLEWIGEERLATMGYDVHELELALAESGNSQLTKMPLDVVREARSRRQSMRWRRSLDELDSPLPIWAEDPSLANRIVNRLRSTTKPES